MPFIRPKAIKFKTKRYENYLFNSCLLNLSYISKVENNRVSTLFSLTIDVPGRLPINLYKLYCICNRILDGLLIYLYHVVIIIKLLYT